MNGPQLTKQSPVFPGPLPFPLLACSGPKPCELPQAAEGRPIGAGNLEGQRLLNEAAAALRASHVEFAHQAHQDLTEVGIGRIVG